MVLLLCGSMLSRIHQFMYHPSRGPTFGRMILTAATGQSFSIGSTSPTQYQNSRVLQILTTSLCRNTGILIFLCTTGQQMITMMTLVLPCMIILMMLPWKTILEVLHQHHLQADLLVDQAEDQYHVIGQDQETKTNLVLPWTILLKMSTEIILEMILQHNLQLCHLRDQQKDQDHVIGPDQETKMNLVLPVELIQEMIQARINLGVLHLQYLRTILHENQPANLNVVIGRDQETVSCQILQFLRQPQTNRRRRIKVK